MGRYCILCGKDSAKSNKKISYHKFPKDVVQRKMWLEFCKVNEMDITSSTMLCNKHFKEEDFLIRAGDNYKILKIGSLPSNRESNKITDSMANGTVVLEYLQEEDKITERLGQEINVINSSNLSHESNENPVLIEEQANVDMCVTSESIVNCPIETTMQYPGNINESYLETPEKAEMTLNMCITSESITTEPIERTIRYPGDINISHLRTPEKAEIALNIAKKTILEQRRKIKALQQASNRHREKISSLKNLVEQLKKNNLISESAAKILLTQVSYGSNKTKENS